MALTETDVSDVGLGLGGRHVGMLREEPEEEGLRETIGGVAIVGDVRQL